MTSFSLNNVFSEDGKCFNNEILEDLIIYSYGTDIATKDDINARRKLLRYANISSIIGFLLIVIEYVILYFNNGYVYISNQSSWWGVIPFIPPFTLGAIFFVISLVLIIYRLTIKIGMITNTEKSFYCFELIPFNTEASFLLDLGKKEGQKVLVGKVNRLIIDNIVNSIPSHVENYEYQIRLFKQLIQLNSDLSDALKLNEYSAPFVEKNDSIVPEIKKVLANITFDDATYTRNQSSSMTDNLGTFLQVFKEFSRSYENIVSYLNGIINRINDVVNDYEFHIRNKYYDSASPNYQLKSISKSLSSLSVTLIDDNYIDKAFNKSVSNLEKEVKPIVDRLNNERESKINEINHKRAVDLDNLKRIFNNDIEQLRSSRDNELSRIQSNIDQLSREFQGARSEYNSLVSNRNQLNDQRNRVIKEARRRVNRIPNTYYGEDASYKARQAEIEVDNIMREADRIADQLESEIYRFDAEIGRAESYMNNISSQHSSAQSNYNSTKSSYNRRISDREDRYENDKSNIHNEADRRINNVNSDYDNRIRIERAHITSINSDKTKIQSFINSIMGESTYKNNKIEIDFDKHPFDGSKSISLHSIKSIRKVRDQIINQINSYKNKIKTSYNQINLFSVPIPLSGFSDSRKIFIPYWSINTSSHVNGSSSKIITPSIVSFIDLDEDLTHMGIKLDIYLKNIDKHIKNSANGQNTRKLNTSLILPLIQVKKNEYYSEAFVNISKKKLLHKEEL